MTPKMILNVNETGNYAFTVFTETHNVVPKKKLRITEIY